MSIWHGMSKKKLTGGKVNFSRKKRKYELGRLPTLTTLGKESRKTIRTKGNRKKTRISIAEFANVYDEKEKTTKKVKIQSVLENPANPNYPRRNIITKGALIQTEIGKAKVTSRPSQHGVVNAILVEK